MDISTAIEGVAHMARIIIIGAAVFGVLVVVIGAVIRR